ncbi:hypothetical protein KC324_g52 [Hortaea werneckii]|nr:hypothetical protein KC324_g52 [Hortaea werneckii]
MLSSSLKTECLRSPLRCKSEAGVMCSTTHCGFRFARSKQDTREAAGWNTAVGWADRCRYRRRRCCPSCAWRSNCRSSGCDLMCFICLLATANTVEGGSKLNFDIAVAGADGIDCRSVCRIAASYEIRLLPLHAYHLARSLGPVFQVTRSAKN